MTGGVACVHVHTNRQSVWKWTGQKKNEKRKRKNSRI